jgi:hypothetical protein
MGLLNSLFGKRPCRLLDDPDFGRIKEDKVGSWRSEDFQLWGYSSIQVMLDGSPEGPTCEQRSFIRTLCTDPEGIRDRIEQAIAQQAKETTNKPGPLKLTSLYLPKAPPGQMWRVWYGVEGEDHHWYGAEIEGWQHIEPFTED